MALATIAVEAEPEPPVLAVPLHLDRGDAPLSARTHVAPGTKAEAATESNAESQKPGKVVKTVSEPTYHHMPSAAKEEPSQAVPSTQQEETRTALDKRTVIQRKGTGFVKEVKSEGTSCCAVS